MHGINRRWRRLSRLVVFGLVAAITCVPLFAQHAAPPGWKPPAVVALRSTHGGWISVESTVVTEGELIAVDQTAFYVLTRSGFESVPRASVRRITLTGYGNRARRLALWSALGGASALSHGILLLFTAPMWAVGGVVASLKEKHATIWHDEDVAFRFARFPQGLPSGFDPMTLGPLPERVR
jgi:hypothetical protein